MKFFHFQIFLNVMKRKKFKKVSQFEIFNEITYVKIFNVSVGLCFCWFEWLDIVQVFLLIESDVI